MKACLRNICLIAFFLLLFACSREAKVIPRGKMAKIYAEMLVTDQWINSTPSVKRMADTSLVYEPILEKYGYSSADYRKSVETYMDDPERYSRILRTTAEILDKRIKELQQLKIDLYKSAFKITTNFKAEDYFPFLSAEPYIHYYDSVSVAWDSNGFYRMVYIENLDSLAVADSLAKADSLAVIDSLAVRVDSLDKIDSLAKIDSFAKIDSLARIDSLSKTVRDKKTGRKVPAASGNILAVKGDTTVVDKEERVKGKSWLKQKE